MHRCCWLNRANRCERWSLGLADVQQQAYAEIIIMEGGVAVEWKQGIPAIPRWSIVFPYEAKRARDAAGRQQGLVSQST